MNRIKNALCITAPIVAAALIPAFTAQGQGPLRHGEYTTSHLHVNLKAKGLLPDSVFGVFLNGFEDAHPGAAGYLGELETNEEGRGSMRVDAAMDIRNSLNHAVLRLSNIEAEDVCFAPATGPLSPAGRTASLATIFIRESRSIDDNASLFHTINWRSTKCVSTF